MIHTKSMPQRNCIFVSSPTSGRSSSRSVLAPSHWSEQSNSYSAAMFIGLSLMLTFSRLLSSAETLVPISAESLLGSQCKMNNYITSNGRLCFWCVHLSVLSVHLPVCLLVCVHDNSKSKEQGLYSTTILR